MLIVPPTAVHLGQQLYGQPGWKKNISLPGGRGEGKDPKSVQGAKDGTFLEQERRGKEKTQSPFKLRETEHVITGRERRRKRPKVRSRCERRNISGREERVKDPKFVQFAKDGTFLKEERRGKEPKFVQVAREGTSHGEER